ncbi:MAG TPA: pitrilysin family protein [Myxococcales bacterium LLY-WYZ-16_1]|nr:pitrilysin family protein [Myxococcales bacterium LLY-WYZ-16_1]
MTPRGAFRTLSAVLNVALRTLSNGLRIVALELPHVHSMSAALMVRTGPRFERPEENGIAHLVEHLLFRGTESHPTSVDFHAAVERVGGEVNGLTQRDATTVHITVPPRAGEVGLRLLGELCTQPTLSGLDVERDVVLEEILDAVDAEGNELDLDSLSRRVFWRGHPMSLPVAGEAELVESFTERECRAFFERSFVAENAVLAVAGPIDPEQCFAWAQAAFSHMPRGRPLDAGAPPLPLAHPRIHVQATDDAQVSALLTFAAPHENDPAFSQLLLLKRILEDGFASRLRQSVCERRGLAYSVSASIDAYQDVGAFDIEVTCSPKKLYAAVEQIWTTLDEMRATPVGEDELDRAKARHRADLDFALDDPNEICSWYGASVLVGAPVGYEAWSSGVLASTAEAVRDLAHRLFRSEDALLSLLGPVDERTVRRLERLMGRPEGTTVWLGEESDDEPDESSGPRLVVG